MNDRWFIPIRDEGVDLESELEPYQTDILGFGVFEGAELKAFKLEGVRITVGEPLMVVPYGVGGNLHFGRIGVYRVDDEMGRSHFALIKTYQAFEGDWRCTLEGFADTAEGM